jgi:hypothetical protein
MKPSWPISSRISSSLEIKVKPSLYLKKSHLRSLKKTFLKFSNEDKRSTR